jgi:hypothetical protein
MAVRLAPILARQRDRNAFAFVLQAVPDDLAVRAARANLSRSARVAP